MIIMIIITTTSTSTINIAFTILIIIKTRCVMADLVIVDKDKAVVGVEAARGESLLDRLARQLGRASNLASIVVIIGSRRLPRKSSGS